MTLKTFGVCKLTGHRGQFVESHLLPKALTRPEQRGNYFVEGGQKKRPIRRYSSWYDPALVIRKGEDILRDYDNAGISELRRLKLIWSSWNGAGAYSGSDLTLFHETLMPGQGIRAIRDAKAKALRLFFLSLLWRAAATDLKEFGGVQLAADELDTLRTLVMQGSPGAPDFYPITLTQIITRALTHNLTPFGLDRTHDLGDGKSYRLNVFRFYFDGLIAYFHRAGSKIGVPEVGAFLVGHGPTLAVQCIPTEGSFEMGNLLKGNDEVYLQWLTTMARLAPKGAVD